MTNSLKNIYQSHHRNNREDGFSIMEKERGELLTKTIGQNKTVLDIGCRDGALTKHFASGNKVTGIDIDENALARARQSLGIQTKEMDLNADWAELSGEKFDVVVAGEILEHLYYPGVVMRKVAEHLKPGGIFVGSVPNAFSLKNRLRYARGLKRHTPLNDPTHINHFSYSELKGLLEKNFQSVEIIGLGRYEKLSKRFPGAVAFDLFFIAKI